MQITLNIKPITVTAKTRQMLEHKIRNVRSDTFGFCCGSDGTYISTRGGDRIVYNAEKKRPKFSHGTWNHDNLSKFPKKRLKNSIKIRDGGWTAWVYVFPKGFPVIVNQKRNHFDIKTKDIR